ncbi:hypothetical protein HDV00_002540 [Rhizophlyctis rosea]|nr:hypothetical protein HDV00_002540 [Rhizophlyctis rosea]
MSAPTPATLPPAAPIVATPFPLTNSLNSFFTALRASSPLPLRNLILALHTTILPHVQNLETRAHSNPVLIAIWRNSGIPPIGFALIACVAILASVRRMLTRTPLLLTNLVGVVYPAYSSIRAVERPEKDDDERWLTYWSIYGFYTLIDSTSKSFLSYMPLYHLPKLMILYWLFGKDGALVAYRTAIRPFLVRYGGYGVVQSIVNSADAATASGVPLTARPDAFATLDSNIDTPVQMEPLPVDTTTINGRATTPVPAPVVPYEVRDPIPVAVPETVPVVLSEQLVTPVASINGTQTPEGGRSGRSTPTPTVSPSKKASKKGKNKSKSRERSLEVEEDEPEDTGDVGRDPVPAQ